MDKTKQAPPEERTVYVANFTNDVDEDLLEELFTQTGPVVKVVLREVKDSSVKFALVEFEDSESVIYSIELMDGIDLFGQALTVKPRNKTKQEELYHRMRNEIESRQSAAKSHDRRRDDRDKGDRDRGSRDWRNDSRGRSRESRDWERNNRNGAGGDSSWNRSNRHQNDYLPPPPPPPPMPPRDSWRGNGSHHSTPQGLPHQHFVNHMLQNRSAPPTYNDRRDNYQNYDPPHRNRNDYSRNDNRRRGGGHGRY